MTPGELLDGFSPGVRRKALKLATATDTSVVVDGVEVFPQAWTVQSDDRSRRYSVRLVCAPGAEAVAEREIHGASCTCLNGQNTSLGSPRCYHVAAVLHRLAGLD